MRSQGSSTASRRSPRDRGLRMTTGFGAGIRLGSAEPIATIVIDNPAKRNAVDRAVATALREAFAAFEADDALRVVVLWGAGGTFCAGADLTALDDDERRNEVEPTGTGPGPMGPTRMALAKPAVAAIAGFAVAGGL